MLGFRRATVLSRAQFEAGDELLIEVSHDQLGHGAPTTATLSSLSMSRWNISQATEQAPRWFRLLFHCYVDRNSLIDPKNSLIRQVTNLRCKPLNYRLVFCGNADRWEAKT